MADGTVKCIDDEIPFEIPASWEWRRLGSIIDFSKSNSVKSDSIPDDIWVLDLEDIEKDTGNLLTKKRKVDVEVRSEKHIFFIGNVLYSKLRPYLNKVIIADENGVCTSEILAFDFGLIFNKYAQAFLMSPYFTDYAMSDAYGVKMPRIGSKQGNNALMPIPPINEQYRIIAQIESISPKISIYGQSQSELDLLNITVKDRLKKSILLEAIQGKLVPQDPSDEPASVLLERIRAEKERLIKEKKIKRDKNESVIYKGDDNSYCEKLSDGSVICIDEEIPFEIPNGWEWSRVRSISESYIGLTYKPTDISEYGTIVLRSSNIKNGKMTYDDIVRVKCQISERLLVHENDILICARNGSKKLVGKSALIKENNELMTFGAFMCICKSSLYEYLFMYLQSELFYSQLREVSGTTTINQLTQNSFNSFLVPIPPFAEQNRILHKLRELEYNL
jgi:type I restriction enzyme S subunit